MSEAEALFEEDLDDDDDDFIEENLDDDDDDFIEENLDDDDDLIEEDLDDDDDFIEENLEDSDSFNEKDFEAHDFEQAASEEVLDDDGLLMDEDDIVEERVWTAEDKDFIANLFDNGSKTESNILSTVPNIDYVKEQSRAVPLQNLRRQRLRNLIFSLLMILTLSYSVQISL